MSWGLNKGVTPYAFGTNINGTWTNLGTVSSAGIWNLTIPALPGLSSNVIPAVGMPGLNMANCTSTATCGWFLYSSPTAYPAANTPTLRVQQFRPATGGPTGGYVNPALWVLGSSGANNPEFYWPLTSVLYNTTLASTGAENVAINGTAFKQLGSNPPGSVITKTWGGNFVCDDQTGVIDPPPGAQCIGIEDDLYIQAGMSTDVNKQRVIMHLAGGPKTTDTNAHIGRALLISPIGRGVIDNAIELLEDQGGGFGETFVVKGDGSTKISSNLGNWSSFNIGKQLVVGSRLSAINNPGIGILDTNSSNPWAIANSLGDLKFYAMPALNDSTSAPVTALTLARPNGAASFNSSVAIRTNNLLTFADATGAISGTNGTAILNNSGTTYIDSYSGPFTFRGNSFAVLATLSSTSATFNVPIKLNSYTVAGLAAALPCNAGAEGSMAYVTDANAPAYNATVVGGGAVKVPVFCNGANWTAH